MVPVVTHWRYISGETAPSSWVLPIDLDLSSRCLGVYCWYCDVLNRGSRQEDDQIQHMDRFLVQGSLLLEKRLISSKILPKFTSDHNPILLLLEEEENLGPLPFLFNPLWTKKYGYMKIVQMTWSTPITGSHSFMWEKKLNSTKLTVKDWAKNHVNTPSSHRRETV